MSAPLFDLSDRCAIVTGASRGIGRAIAIGFAQAGATVLVVARSQRGLDEVQQTIGAFGGRCEVLAADVAAPEAALLVRSEALRHAPTVDILVNNAACFVEGPALDLDDATWVSTMRVNVD